ncbi:MAG TPA: hypothetical protein ENJ09_12550 [Planctomycetes bacterium]|nr:hypothetical protein [Planctomycetota bacterium]
MSPTIGFPLFLVITLAFLGGVVATGYAAHRRRHIPLVVCSVISLGITIFFAERLGHLFDLKATGWIYPFHLALAKTTTLSYLLPVVFGSLTIREPTWLLWHRRVAYLVLFLTVITAATGAWMLCIAERLPGVS